MDDDYAAKVAAGLVSIAEQAGHLVGLIVVVANHEFLMVENIAVDPDVQGRGVGRALLAHADDIAGELGVEEIRLYTNAAMTENLAFYPRLGYHETGRRSEDGYDRVFFAKPTPA